MTKKTIAQIREEHGAKASAILQGYHAELDDIRGMRKPAVDPHLSEYLSDEQRFSLLRDQKREKADAARARALDAYRREMSRYQGELEARAGYVSGELFGMTASQDAATLSRAALASEAELSTMLDLAARSGNQGLAQAVFVAADNRGFPELAIRYFEEVAPEARDAYAEWSEIPSAEDLDRQHGQAEQMIAPPDYERLAGTPAPNY